MHVVQISGTDKSAHTNLADAQAQQQRYIDAGEPAGNVTIVEKDNPSFPEA